MTARGLVALALLNFNYMTTASLIHQKSYERIIYLLHRSPVTFVPVVLFFILLLVLPMVLGLLIKLTGITWFDSQIGFTFITLFASLYLMSVGLFFYSYFVTFYLDMWVITNDRLVDVRQVSLFSRTIAEVDLYQIQDVTSEVNGIFASIFNFGNIYLQTAGPMPRFVLYNVVNPHRLRQIILDLAADDKKYHNK